jgi:hypothetical protein
MFSRSSYFSRFWAPFGGLVLVGVDEDKVGAERLVGANPSERDRLKDMSYRSR